MKLVTNDPLSFMLLDHPDKKYFESIWATHGYHAAANAFAREHGLLYKGSPTGADDSGAMYDRSQASEQTQKGPQAFPIQRTFDLGDP